MSTEAWVEDEGRRPDARGAGDTKTCPMCGQTIKAVARKCRFCGEMLEGGPLPADSGEMWRDGKQLVMSKGIELPYVCLKSNQPAEGWLRRKLSWHHPAVFLALIGGLIPYVVVALITRKTADINVGLSDEWFRRRRNWIITGWVIALAAVGLFIAGASHENGWLIVVAFFGGLFGVILSLMRSNIVSPARITDQHVWLKGVHPDFLAELPVWPGDR